MANKYALQQTSGVDVNDVVKEVTDTAPLPVSATGTVTVTGVALDATLTGGTQVAQAVGNVANDGVDAGAPVKIGGKANSAAPTAVSAGDRVDGWFSLAGRPVVAIGTTSASADGLSAPLTVADSADLSRPLAVATTNFNGTNWDRVRTNMDLTLLASAARTGSLNSSDFPNYNARGVQVVVDVTLAGTGSITLTIQGKDSLSGQYYTLLAGAAVVTVSTNVYRVYPGLVVAANAAANDFVPRVFRASIVHNNANTITYSVGASLIY